MSVPRLECATLVLYFNAVPVELGRLLTTARVLASTVVGPLAVRTTVSYRAASEDEIEQVLTTGKVRTRIVQDSLGSPSELDTEDFCAASSYWSYDEPEDRERNVETFAAIDFTWRLRFEDWCSIDGIRTGPYLAMDFVLGRMRRKVGELTELVTRFSECVSSCPELCSGLCDIGDYCEISLGDYYSGKTLRRTMPQRRIALHRWLQAGSERANMARGVYWANLFGRKMVERLGGAERFEKEYSKYDRGMSRGIVHRVSGGALLVYLCEYCNRFMYPYSPEYEERAAWLYRRLADVGLMC